MHEMHGKIINNMLKCSGYRRFTFTPAAFILYLSLALSLSLGQSRAEAYMLKLSCGGAGSITGYDLNGAYQDLAEKLRLVSGLGQVESINQDAKPACSEQPLSSSLNGKADRTMLLVNEFNSRAANKSSRYFDRGAIREIVDLAVSEGIDPYMALSIVLMEKPPVRPKPNRSETYSHSYGVLPLDAVSVVDGLGCRFVKDPRELRGGDSISSEDVANYSASFQAWSRINRQLRDLGVAWKGMSESQRNSSRGQDLRRRTKELENQEMASLSDPALRRLERDDHEKYRKLMCLSDLTLCYGILTQDPSRVPTINLAPAGTAPKELVDMDACINSPNIQIGGSGDFDFSVDPPASWSRRCCAHLKVAVKDAFDGLPGNLPGNLKDTARASGQASSGDPSGSRQLVAKVEVNAERMEDLLRRRIAIGFLKSRIQDALSRRHPAGSVSEISQALQAYNGYGTMNATERSGSACLSGIKMAKQPVYGATAADIMLNMLIADPEMRKLVADSAKTHGRSPVSLFCIAHGPGEISIDTSDPVSLEQQYLAGRPACSRGDSPVTYQPWSLLQASRALPR